MAYGKIIAPQESKEEIATFEALGIDQGEFFRPDFDTREQLSNAALHAVDIDPQAVHMDDSRYKNHNWIVERYPTVHERQIIPGSIVKLDTQMHIKMT